MSMLRAGDVTEHRSKYKYGLGFCPVCGKSWFKSSEHDRRVYCSSACKQRAYRQRKDPMTGSLTNLRKRGAAAAATKHGMAKRVTCECCGEEFWASGNNYGMTFYCSKACKQKAYRQRKAALRAGSVTR